MEHTPGDEDEAGGGAPSEMAAEEASEMREPEPRHVLIVEDEELVALAMVDDLRRIGWSIVGPAGTLEEAQALVESGAPIDAAILDVNLQGRWVHALAESLKERGVPFLVCTGYEIVDPDSRFKGAPLIMKPVMIDRLGPALDQLIGAAEVNQPKVEPGSA